MNHLNIFPQIKPREYIESENNNLVYKDLLSNLVVCLVEDTGNTMEYLSVERVNSLDLNLDTLYKVASENLYNLKETTEGLRIMDHGDGTKAITYETHDSYDAARFVLLFNRLLNRFIETIGDPFLVAIPCRDFLLAVPQTYENKLSGYAAKLYETKDNPITKELFLFSKNESTFKND